MSRNRLLSEACKHRAVLFQPAASLQEQASPTLHCTTRFFSSSICPPTQRRASWEPVFGRGLHEKVFNSRFRHSGITCRCLSATQPSAEMCRWASVSLAIWQHRTPSVAATRQTHSLPHRAATCWFCGEGLQLGSLLTCPNCGYIQKIHEDLNYFQLFGLCVPLAHGPACPRHSSHPECSAPVDST